MAENRMQMMENWPVFNKAVYDREGNQFQLVLNLMKWAYTGPLPGRVDADFIGLFRKMCELAAEFDMIIYDDSRFYPDSLSNLTFCPPYYYIAPALNRMNQRSVGGKTQEKENFDAVLKLLSDRTFSKIDSQLILDIDDAIEQVWHAEEIRSRCEMELKDNPDPVQRAALYLEMGDEIRAHSEFKRITSEDLQNPESLLDLVDLFDHFVGKVQAIRILKDWFITQFAKHSIAMELMADALFPGFGPRNNPRLEYLRDMFFFSQDCSTRYLRDSLLLVFPRAHTFTVDQAEADRICRCFGLQRKMEWNLFAESDPVNFVEFLSEACFELNHLATLLIQTKQFNTALMCLERSTIVSFLLLFAPKSDSGNTDSEDFRTGDPLREQIIMSLQEPVALLDFSAPEKVKSSMLYHHLQDQLEKFGLVLQSIFSAHSTSFNVRK